MSEGPESKARRETGASSPESAGGDTETGETARCEACGRPIGRDATTCAVCGTPRADAGLQPGSMFAGRYEVLGAIGRGGFGAIYKVRHVLINEVFALKLLKPELLASPTYRKRFLREGKIASRFSHPNAVTLREFGVEGGAPFMTMDFVEGPTLGAAIKAAGAIAPRRAVAIGRGILGALGAAHHAGIVHRDLKPENVILEPLPGGLERVRVLDLGVAKLVDEESEHSRASSSGEGVVIGTIAYMAPEQGLGQRVDLRADIYACGVVLYEMLTGTIPFPTQGCTQGEAILRAISQRPQQPSARRPDVWIPADLEAVILRALEKKPEDRFASAEEFDAALAALESVRFPGLLRSEEPPEVVVARTSGGRRPALAATLALAAIAVAAIALIPAVRRLVRPTWPAAEERPVSRTGARPAAPTGIDALAALEAAGAPASTPAVEPATAPAEEAHPAARRPLPPRRYGPRDDSELVLVPAGPFRRGSTPEEVAAFVDSIGFDEANFAAYARALGVGTARDAGELRRRLIAVYADETPARPVEVGAFYIQRFPVTEGQYARFLAATNGRHDTCPPEEPRDRVGNHVPRHWEGMRPAPGREGHPVVSISWDDARAYAAWAGMRLPTEAEYEKAARGTEGLIYPWGDEWDGSRCRAASAVAGREIGILEHAAWLAGLQERARREGLPPPTLPLGAPGEERFASPFGALHMTGNVSCWCLDYYDPGFFAEAAGRDPIRLDLPPPRPGLTTLGTRAVRGGSWLSTRFGCRAAARAQLRPEVTALYLGFRCVLTPEGGP